MSKNIRLREVKKIGKYNSTFTRVKPVFDSIFALGESGGSWLPKLLRLPSIRGKKVSLHLPNNLGLICSHWGDNEKQLRPPISLLRWLVQNLEHSVADGLRGSGETISKRKALINKDKQTPENALVLLSEPSIPDEGWYILEGITHPDVYLETPDLIVVIEGKRTEREPTRKTKWMRTRDQMLRHLDCAHELNGLKKIVGFYIVEGGEKRELVTVPEKWIKFAEETISCKIVNESLPH